VAEARDFKFRVAQAASTTGQPEWDTVIIMIIMLTGCQPEPECHRDGSVRHHDWAWDSLATFFADSEMGFVGDLLRERMSLRLRLTTLSSAGIILVGRQYK
jgi:hypothetical protein